MLKRFKASRKGVLLWVNGGIAVLFLGGYLTALEVCGRIGKCSPVKVNPLAVLGADPLLVLLLGNVIALLLVNLTLLASYREESGASDF